MDMSDAPVQPTRASDAVLPESASPPESASVPALPAGRVLGKYRLLRRIGRGGMGEVYEAEDTVLQRNVALKLLPESVAGDARRLERFVREARAAARLNHPNVVTVYDVGQEAGAAWLALELVAGETLQGRLESGTGLPWREATRVIADVCRGLAAAHAAGIVHRDIKPSNILRTPEGVAKLADFGLAKALDAEGGSLTGSGFVLGTPHFMSPEQCRAEPTDERSDLYSLGATYYALLTAQPPFGGTAALQILFAHCSNPPPDPREKVPDVPDRCAAIVRRCMAKEPRDRYAHVPELLAEVESVLTGTPAAAAVRGPEAVPVKSAVVEDSPGNVPTRVPAASRETVRPVPTKDELFAEAVVKNRFATIEQVEEALAARRAAGGDADVAAVLVGRGLLNAEQVEKLRRAVEVAWKRMVDGAGPEPTPVDPLAGKVLAGEFKLVRLIGRGGMGSVYVGEQLSLGRKVAVKLLPLAALAAPDLLERFKREARAAAKLQHPNIVQVHYCGEEAGQPFIVMEFVEGRSLGDRLARDGKLPIREALAVALQTARALGAAHKQGIVHRDLKPDNIFVGKDGAVKLGDFGLARDLSGLPVSISGEVMGTPRYMAPEQCRGMKVDGRADLYALGATIFHMVAGVPPFDGDSLLEIMNKHVSAPLPSLREAEPAAPESLETLVRRLMEKDPGARPQAADEVIASVQAVLAGKPVGAAAGTATAAAGGVRPAIAAAGPAAVAPTARPARLGEAEALDKVRRIGLEPPKRDREKDAIDEFQARRMRGALMAGGFSVAAVLAFVFLMMGGSGGPAPKGAGGPGKTAGPETPVNAVANVPVPANTTTPVAVKEPENLGRARKALAAADLAAALDLLNKVSAEERYDAFEEAWKTLRAEIATAAKKLAEPHLARYAAALDAKRFSEAGRALDEVEDLGLPDLAETVKSERARLAKAEQAARAEEEAIRQQAAEAEARALREVAEREQAERVARERADAEWAKRAPAVWAQAGKREWDAALAACTEAEKDPALAPHVARLEALGRVIARARAADRAVVTGLRGALETAQTFKRRTGGSVSGKVDDVTEAGKISLSAEGGKVRMPVQTSELANDERRKWADKALAKDPDRLAALAAGALADGDLAWADVWLQKPVAERGAAGADFDAAAEGWQAPWSAAAVAKRNPTAGGTGDGVDPDRTADPKPTGKDDLVALSDEFTDIRDLARWKRLWREEGWKYDPLEHHGLQGGVLGMMPYASGWFQDFHAELTYQEVEGDFVATAAVAVSGKDGRSNPRAQFSLGGLMARGIRRGKEWQAGQENYVFVSVGVAYDVSQRIWEWKNTIRSTSEVTQEPAGVLEGEVRIARIHPHVILLVRPKGGDWRVLKRLERGDLSKRLQVGVTAYTDWRSVQAAGVEAHNRGEVSRMGGGSPDLIARFDYVRFRRPQVPASLRGKDLEAVSDGALLEFLGEAADGK